MTDPRPGPRPEPAPVDPVDVELARPHELLGRRAPVPSPASRFGISAVLVEDVASRDAHRKQYVHPDGRTRTVVIGSDLHYQQPDGTWDDVDLTLAPVRVQVQARVGSGMQSRQVHVTRAPCPVVVDPGQAGARAPRVQITDDQGRGIRYLLPVAPTIVGGEITYQDQGLTWRYRPLPRGLKLTANVTTRLGARAFTFAYELLGAVARLSVGPDGALESGVFRIPPPTATGADGAIYQVGAWRVDGTTLVLEYDDTALPGSAFPLELDPTTTFSVGAGGDDAIVQGIRTSYPPAYSSAISGNANNLTSRSFDGTNYTVSVGLIRWDTSSLAGAIITSATARLYIASKSNTDTRSVQLEWYNWTPPASSADYTTTASGTANSGVAIDSLTASAYNDFALSNPDTSINKSGYTGLRVHISGGQPTSANSISWRAFESGSNVPQLVVTYTIPVALSGSAAGSTVTGAAPLARVWLLSGTAAGSTTTGAANLQLTMAAAPAAGSTTTGAAALFLAPLAVTGGGAGSTAATASLSLAPLALLGAAMGGTTTEPLALEVYLLLTGGTAVGRTVASQAALLLLARYRLLVDWAGDGAYAHPLADVTPDLLEVSCVLGRERPFEFESLARVGELSARLVNRGGKYSLYQSTSPLAGLLRPGKGVRLQQLVDGQYVPIWTGRLDRLVPRAGMPPEAELRAVGGLEVLTKRAVWTAPLASVPTHAAVTAVLDAAGWPTSQRQISTGSTTLARFWGAGEDALSLLAEIARDELGLVREAPSGDIVFEGRSYRQSGDRLVVQVTLDPTAPPTDTTLHYLDIAVEDPVESVLNEVTWTTQSYAMDPVGEVWRLEAVPFSLAPGEARTVTAQYPPSGGAAGSYVASWEVPTVGLPGSGADVIVSATTVTATLTDQRATRATLTLTNTGGSPVTVSQVSLRGSPVRAGSQASASASDSQSQAIYGRRGLEVRSRYLSDPNVAQDYATGLVNQYASPVPVVRVVLSDVQGPATARQLGLRGVSDRVRVREPWVLGIDVEGYIERVERTITPTEGRVMWLIAPVTGVVGAWVLGTSQLGVDTKLGF